MIYCRQKMIGSDAMRNATWAKGKAKKEAA